MRLRFSLEGNEAQEKSSSLDQGIIHFLFKVHFEGRKQMIFPSKIWSHDHMIFLHRVMRHCLKGVRIFSDFSEKEREGLILKGSENIPFSRGK